MMPIISTRFWNAVGTREVGEDHQEDKDVVHRQGLLDQVAGQEFQRLGIGHLGGAGAVLHGPPEQAVEQEAQGDPDQRPVQRLLDPDVVRTLLFEHHEVDEQRHQHDGTEGGPQPQGSNCFHVRFSLEYGFTASFSACTACGSCLSATAQVLVEFSLK
jgi:hypothetical protein